MTEKERKACETNLLEGMLETLSNTPLMVENTNGMQINQTQRVMWAIKFVQDVAAKRGLKIVGPT